MNLAAGVSLPGHCRSFDTGQDLTPQFVVPTTILNSQFSNLNSDIITGKLDELQMALGSEYLVQYGTEK